MKTMLFFAVAGAMTLGAAAQGVAYLDWDAENSRMTNAVCETYVAYAGETTLAAGATYVLDSNRTVTDRIAVEGTPENPTRLILCGGATLTAKKGVEVAEDRALVVYGQHDSTGTLVASGTSKNAGVGGSAGACGKVTINGGTVIANGGSYGAGIGGGKSVMGGEVTVNGGTVTAKGGAYGAGIGGGDYGKGRSLTVNGGRVSAESVYGAGIGGGLEGSGGEVTLNGGIVTALSSDGAGIGSGYEGSEQDEAVEFGADYEIWAGDDAASATNVSMKAFKEYHGQLYASLLPTVGYLDWGEKNKLMTNALCRAYEVVTNEMRVFEAGKTYVVQGYVTNATGIVVEGTAANPTRLILADGAKLTADVSGRGERGVGIEVQEGRKLIVNVQKGATGALRAVGGNGGAGIGGRDGANGTVVFAGDFTVTAGDDAETARRLSVKSYAATLAGTWVEIEPATGSEERPWVVGATGDVVAWTNGTELVVSGAGTVDSFEECVRRWNALKDRLTSIVIADADVTDVAPDGFAGVGKANKKGLLILPDGWQGALPTADGTWYGAYVELMELPRTVRNVTFKQRYPWNGWVDLGFALTGPAGEQGVEVSVLTNGAATGARLTASVVMPASGVLTTNLVLDAAAAGLGANFKSDDVILEVTMPVVDTYMVIDLNRNGRGKFVATFEDLTAEQANAKFNRPGDGAYKTEKLVLRKVTANAEGYFCSPGASAYPITAKVPVLRDYWIGLFEVTAAQYDRVMGAASPTDAITPKNMISYETIRGTSNPDLKPTDAAAQDNFLKRLCENCVDARGRSISGFDLPTVAQWEIACRAGTAGPFGYGDELTPDDAVFGFAFGAPGAVAQDVGSKRPNAWGLFDMHGNVAEWCRDAHSDDCVPTSAEDFFGLSVGDDRRAHRGGGYLNSADECAASIRACNLWLTEQGYYGFRLCRTMPTESAAAVGAKSAVGRLDLLTGDRMAKEVETLVVDPAWGGASEATVAIDGEREVRTYTHAGDDAWETASLAPGRYEMTFAAGDFSASAAFWKVGEDWVILNQETFAEDMTFAAGKTYLVRGVNTVAEGVALTVEAGAKICYDGESAAVPVPPGVGFRFEGDVLVTLDDEHRLVDNGDLVLIGGKILGCVDNPWKVGDGVLAYTNGTELVIGGEGTIKDLAAVAGLCDLRGGLTAVTISTSAVTGAEANAFGGVGTADAKVLLTLPDGWLGDLPDEAGAWCGGYVELARVPNAIKSVAFAQDWPWREAVEIGLTLTGEEGERTVVLTMFTNGTEKVKSVSSVLTIPAGGVLRTKFVWEALSAELGDFVSDAVQFEAELEGSGLKAVRSAQGSVDVRQTVALPMGETTVAGVTLPQMDGAYKLPHPTEEGVESFVTFLVSGFRYPPGCETNPMPLGRDGGDDPAYAVTNGLNVYVETERGVVDARKLKTLCGGAEMEAWLVGEGGAVTSHVEMIVGPMGTGYDTLADALAADELPETFEFLKRKIYWVTYDCGRDAQGEPQPTGEMATEWFDVAVATNLAAVAYEREDFAFDHWEGMANGEAVAYGDQAEALDLVAPGETLALTARWTRVAVWIAVTNLENAVCTVTTNGIPVETTKAAGDMTLWRVESNAAVTVTFRATNGFVLSTEGKPATVHIPEAVHGESDVVADYPTVVPVAGTLYTKTDASGRLVIIGAEPTADGVLVIPAQIDGKDVAEIGAGAFTFERDLKEVIIEEGVTKIGGAAFFNCPSLVTLSVPSTVVSVGEMAFARCFALKTVVFGGDAPVFDWPTIPGDTIFSDSLKGLKIIVPTGASGWDSEDLPQMLCSPGTVLLPTNYGYCMADPPTIIGFTLVSADEVMLEVGGVRKGVSYAVERCDAQGSDWTAIGGRTVAEADGTLVFIGSCGGGQAFYRIVVE